MTSTSETGHAKNVANFKLLIEHLGTHGAQYSPSNPAIALTALQQKYDQAAAAMKSHRTVKVTYDDATNAREIHFKDIRSLATRIVNALEASGASAQKVKDAKTIVRKIRGERAPGKSTMQPTKPQPISPTDPVIPSGAEGQNGVEGQNGTKEQNTISASQLSFDQRAENFAKLIEVIQSEPLYNPTEPDLKVTTLQTYNDQLLQSTGTVAGKIAAYSASINHRDQELYATDTGLPDLTRDIKAYVKSVYGSASQQYKAINAIRIQQIKR